MTTPATASATRPFSDSYLLAYSADHVWYEVRMFFGIVDVVSRRAQMTCVASRAVMETLNNSLIEAFAVHLRNVVDFLYNDQPKPTDVVAADFCAPSSWHAVRPTISQVLEDARNRTNKQIAHLTTERLTGDSPGKRWPFVALADEVRPLLKLFVPRANPRALSPRVASVIR